MEDTDMASKPKPQLRSAFFNVIRMAQLESFSASAPKRVAEAKGVVASKQQTVGDLCNAKAKRPRAPDASVELRSSFSLKYYCRNVEFFEVWKEAATTLAT